MATVDPTAPAEMPGRATPLSNPQNIPAASGAIERALALLGRASADWRNREPSADASLHWPISVNLARRALRQALEALEPVRWPPDQTDADGDTLAGMAWFNALLPAERRHWLEVADSAVPADAWRAFTSSSEAHS